MKPIVFLLLVLSAVLSCRPNSKKVYILNAGKGFDNLEVGKSTLQDLTINLGNNYKIDTFYLQPILAPGLPEPDTIIKTTVYSICYSFDSLGIKFFFKPSNKTFFSITVRKPFNGQTDKGIVLNQSTFRDVVAKYGKTSWSFSGDNIMKSYDGISFLDKGYDGTLISDSELVKCIDNKITEIAIEKIRSAH